MDMQATLEHGIPRMVAGTKQDMVKAYTTGQVVPAGHDADLAQHALHLQHWLETDALYGINYIQVGKLL